MCVHVKENVCACMEDRQMLYASSLTRHFSFFEAAYLSEPELTDSAMLAGQPALGIGLPLLCQCWG